MNAVVTPRGRHMHHFFYGKGRPPASFIRNQVQCLVHGTNCPARRFTLATSQFKALLPITWSSDLIFSTSVAEDIEFWSQVSLGGRALLS
jgi:hypothetical protein